jgi:hypothetical protein
MAPVSYVPDTALKTFHPLIQQLALVLPNANKSPADVKRSVTPVGFTDRLAARPEFKGDYQ